MTNHHHIPITVGVTGHRDLRPEDIDKLEYEVRGILRELRASYPSSPIFLFSPLAEGADRLVARIALAEGVSLIVPMPLPQPEYERDFQTSESRQEFRQLLGAAYRRYFVGFANGADDTAVRSDSKTRNEQYERVGAHIVRQTHLMLALWDGTCTGLKGGTAEIVRFALMGLPPRYVENSSPLDPIDRGPVYHIVTPRRRDPPPVDALALRVLFPGSAETSALVEDDAWNTPELEEKPSQQKRMWEQLLARIDEANQAFDSVWQRHERDVRENRSYLIDDDALPHLLENERSMLNVYAAADSLSITAQGRRRRLLLRLLATVLAGFVVFECYDNLVYPPVGWLTLSGAFVYPAVLLASYFGYQLSHPTRLEDDYVDYRALAEGLRVQLAWQLAGAKAAVPDYYLRKQAGALRWIREAIRGCSALASAEHSADGRDASPSPVELSRAQLALSSWIVDQHDYYNRSVERDDKALGKLKRWASGAYFAALAAASIVLGLDVWYIASGGAETLGTIWSAIADPLRGTTFVLFSAFMGLSVTLGGWIETMALPEQAQQYARMGRVLHRARVLSESALRRKRMADFRMVAIDLGAECLQENGDWLTLRRSRPVEAPKS